MLIKVRILFLVIVFSLIFDLSFAADTTVSTALTSSDDEIEITADGENKNVSPAMQNAFGHYAGLSLTKKVKDFNLGFNLEYGRTRGLTNQVVSLSLNKYF